MNCTQILPNLQACRCCSASSMAAWENRILKFVMVMFVSDWRNALRWPHWSSKYFCNLVPAASQQTTCMFWIGGKIHIQNAQIHRSMKGQTVANKLEQHFLGDNAGFKMIQRTHDSSATQIVLVGAFITPTCYQRWNGFLKETSGQNWFGLITCWFWVVMRANHHRTTRRL